MDDTNPTKEDVEYVDSITEDVNWLIGGWADDKLGLKPKGKTPDTITSNGKPDFYLAPIPNSELRTSNSETVEPFYASDYFDQIYEYAVALIKKGKAYVCDLTPEETDEYRRQRQGKPIPQSQHRGKPRPVHAHEERRVPRRQAFTARED